jgi:hypothetical protein
MPTPATPSRTGYLRTGIGALVLGVLLVAGARLAYDYVSNPAIPRPHDFLQVWSAGRLNAAGANPYDGERMYALQVENRMPDCRSAKHPDGYASMMWVPPWALAVAMPLGALPIDLAQLIWGLGQLVLIAAVAVVYWRFCGGTAARQWIPVALVIGSGPVWWQTVGGQNAGLLFLGLVGFLFAQRANRPVLGGACLALAAFKPHLMLLLGIGLLIDATRTGFGRRVVLGGALALAVAAGLATLFNPAVWGQYLTAATGPGSQYYPALRDWINPTVGSHLRQALPGRPFWVQTVPGLVAAAVFAVYWWRSGNPARWPAVLPWIVPVCLITAPYGSWASDLVLMLIPIVAVAARLDARNVAFARIVPTLGVFAAANVAMFCMISGSAAAHAYTWVAPVFCYCILSAARALRPEPVSAPAPEPALAPEPASQRVPVGV